MRKKTLNEFIKDFQNRYGDKYTFENAVYNGNKVLMTVTCPVHGDFNIRPVDLMNGHGCPICGGTKKSNTEEFVCKANIVHNNFFNYNKCNYTNCHSKVTVTCPIHGDFEVRANNHLNGANCKQCHLEGITHKITKLPQVNASSKKLTTEDFINKAKNKWGDRYFYPKTVYFKNNEKLIITCPLHGDFVVTPNHFLSGRGCPKCGGNARKTTESFIKELKSSQPLNEYDYSEVNYVNVHTPIKLTCMKCGTTFFNAPSNLLYYKQGCPTCNESHLENEIRLLLNEHNIKYENYKRFDWLGRLSLDFYLPDYNIGIECQGIQHFIPIIFFGGEDKFKQQAINDEKKRLLCNENDITLLYYADKEYRCDYHIITETDKLLNEIKKNDKT